MTLDFYKYNKFSLSLATSFIVLILYYYPEKQINLTFFHGDDVSLINILKELSSYNSIVEFIFRPSNYKFRPISNIHYYIEYSLFLDNYKLYVLYNILLLLIVNYFMLLCLHKQLNLLSCIFLSLTLVTSKFFVYSIWNITGSFESLALILFLATLRALLLKKHYLKIIVLSTALILTSERYLPFVVILPILYAFQLRNGNIWDSVKAKLQYTILIVGVYFILRTFLDVPVIVGTQVDNVVSSFSISHFSKHFFESVLHTLGYINGPRYLTGLEYPYWLNFNSWGNTSKKILYVQLITVFLAVCLIRFKTIQSKTLYFVFFAMIAAASITFRLELRWLMPCYVVFIILISTRNQKNLDAIKHPRSTLKNVINVFDRISWPLFISVSLLFNIYYLIHLRRNLYFAEHLDKAALWRHIF